MADDAASNHRMNPPAGGSQFVAVDSGYRKAAHCRMCFEGDPKVNTGIIDVAQPRWVGERYWVAKPRALFILLNPGSGESDGVEYNREARRLMHEYRDDRATLVEVLNHQRVHMTDWGRGRFLDFYTTQLELDLAKIAFVNLALCSSASDEHPHWMLRRCLNEHTLAIISSLRPDLAVLSGSDTHKFQSAIRARCPTARVETMLHYANRRVAVVQAADHQRIRDVIADLRNQGPDR